MKALTLTQPWATLVAVGAKRIETRSWQTSYRGPVAIHAAKGYPKWAREFASDPLVYYNAHRCEYTPRSWPTAYPLGFVLATARLVAVTRTGNLTDISDTEFSFGDYSFGRFAWLLDDIMLLEHPIAAKGALGLWEWKKP
jgi:hypothetical protein